MKNIIQRPLVTEKNTMLSEKNIFAFEVMLSASKGEIKSSVEKLFNVKVESVNTLICRGHSKNTRHFVIPPKRWKKALVKLKQGEKISLFEGA